MIEGDLAETGLAELLVELAEGGATGCVTLTDPAGRQGAVHLRQGRPYAASLPAGAGDQPVGDAVAQLTGWDTGRWLFRLDAPLPPGDAIPPPAADAPVDAAVDTAALLRELAALAADEEPDQPVRPAAPRPAAAPRRRGLFARG